MFLYKQLITFLHASMHALAYFNIMLMLYLMTKWKGKMLLHASTFGWIGFWIFLISDPCKMNISLLLISIIATSFSARLWMSFLIKSEQNNLKK